MRIVVYGLWHLGCVTAGCLAAAGHQVVGLDGDSKVVADLAHGHPPIQEPGLDELIKAGLAAGTLSLTTDLAAASDAELVWVTFDTPVDDQDEADVEFIRRRLDALAEFLRPGTRVLISSQVPVGFTASVERRWQGRGLRLAYSPENLRLGKAIEAFTQADRVIVGRRDSADEAALSALLKPFCPRIEWMSVESAEMTKHALNAFLATSVTFINEIARLCEAVGADAREVERGLKSEARIGPRAYLGPGAAFAGGTLARDVRFLMGFGRGHGVDTSLMSAVMASNDAHRQWTFDHVERLIGGLDHPVVAMLGLVYKAGTSTLRRSTAVELALRLRQRGCAVRAHDPALAETPAELAGAVELCHDPRQALAGADVAVVGADWPQYRQLAADDIVSAMRAARVVDPNWFLSASLASDSRILYIATGRA